MATLTIIPGDLLEEFPQVVREVSTVATQDSAGLEVSVPKGETYPPVDTGKVPVIYTIPLLPEPSSFSF